MRKILFVAGAIACLSLNACEKKAEAPVVEAPKKSLARMAPLYQGQDQVASVQSGKVTVAASGGVTLEAKATTDGGGWTDVGFLPRIYAATPPDGVYEVDIVGQKPATPGAAGPTPVEVKGAWDKYTDGRVKGVTFKSKTNEITVKLLTAP